MKYAHCWVEGGRALVLFAWEGSSHSINPALTADLGRVGRAMERSTHCALEVCKGRGSARQSVESSGPTTLPALALTRKVKVKCQVIRCTIVEG